MCQLSRAMVCASYDKTYLSSDSQGEWKEISPSNKNPESAGVYAPRINPANYGSGRMRDADTELGEASELRRCELLGCLVLSNLL